MNDYFRSGILILLSFSLVAGVCLTFTATASAQEPPKMPHAFIGKVYIDEAPAPAGTSVSARWKGEVLAEDRTDADGNYVLKVPVRFLNQEVDVVSFYVKDVDTGITHEVSSQEVTELDLSLEDTTAPSITIDEPEDGAELREETVTVEGSVTDDIATPDQITATLNGDSLTLGSDGSFSEEISLEPGSNTIEVTAEDFAGNSDSESVSVLSDAEAPSIEFSAPSLASSKVATVTGTVTDEVSSYEEISVTINDSPVDLASDGGFSKDVNLTTGSNSFTIEAVDDIGNSASRNFTIVSDTGNPSVSINKPADGKVLMESTVTVEASVNDDVATFEELAVTLNGSEVLLTDGSFSKEISIDPGSNTITVRVEDPAGNSNSDEVSVIRDAEEPQITIDEPEEGHQTTEDTITVSGSVSDDVSEPQDIDVSVAGTSVSVQSDGSFSTDISLELGSNTVTVTARDEAGRESDIEIRNVERLSPTPWALYAAIIAIIAVILAALAIWRARSGTSGGGI